MGGFIRPVILADGVKNEIPPHSDEVLAGQRGEKQVILTRGTYA